MSEEERSGAVTAGQLPDEFLDALAVLRPGEVSGVIETPLGFHVVQRRAVPPEQTVEGRHVIIAYEHMCVCRASVKLHGRALRRVTLARRVLREARAGAAPFEELVVRYSDAPDTTEGGDFGAWSTRDPGRSGIEVEVLSKLSIGEIAEPIDQSVRY